jgi:hypothetical protein
VSIDNLAVLQFAGIPLLSNFKSFIWKWETPQTTGADRALPRGVRPLLIQLIAGDLSHKNTVDVKVEIL